MAIDRKKDQANLDAALAIVREHSPDAVAVHLETSDQGLYGFVLTGVESRTMLIGLPDDAQDQISMLLCDIDWDGVVGESPQGYARIELKED